MSTALDAIRNAHSEVTQGLPVIRIQLKPGEQRMITEGNVVVDGGVPDGASVQLGRGLLRIIGDVHPTSKVAAYHADVAIEGKVLPAAAVAGLQQVMVLGDVCGRVTAEQDIMIGGSARDGAEVRTAHGAIRVDGAVERAALASQYNRIEVGGDVAAGARVLAEHGGICVKGHIHDRAVVLGKHTSIHAGSVSDHAMVQSARGAVHTASSHPRIARGAEHTPGADRARG